MIMLTLLIAISLSLLSVRAYRGEHMTQRSSYPSCDQDGSKNFINFITECQEGHHYGVNVCQINTNRSLDYLPCTACPPFLVSYTLLHYTENYDDYNTNDLYYYSCWDSYSDALYGIVMNTTAFATFISLLALIIMFSLLSTKKEEIPLSIALTALIALPCLDFLTDLSYFLTQCFYNIPVFIACFIIIIFPWMQFTYKLVLMNAHPTLRLIEIPNYLFFKNYDNVFKTVFTGIVYFLFLIINGHIFLFILGGFLYATKLFTITRVSNFWYYYWFGDSRMENKEIVLDSIQYNLLVYGELFYESIPQFMIQLINSLTLQQMEIVDFPATSYISVGISLIVIISGLYRFIYLKLIRKVDILKLPTDLTLGGNILSNKAYKTSMDIDLNNKSSLSNMVAVNRVEPREDRLNPLVAVEPLIDERLKQLEMKISNVQFAVQSDTKGLYARIANLERVVAQLSKNEETIIRL